MPIIEQIENKAELLPASVRAEIDGWIKKYPPEQKQSAVLSALHLAQDYNGWLSEDMMDAVADYLGMARIAVYEVATFYTMYHLKPVGKHTINVCVTLPCQLQGCQKITDHLKQSLGVELGETTADGCFTLNKVDCLGACRNGPVMQIDKIYHENLTPAKVDELLAAAREQVK